MNTPEETVRSGPAWDFLRDAGVFLCLLALGLVVRLPYFFTVGIDWDEATYILMGQSVLDGYLPYTRVWGFKPPLTFLFYAGAIALPGAGIVSVRLAGLLCVAGAAFFTFCAGRAIWNARTGTIAAILVVMMSSVLRSGQATLTEHAAIVPLTGALALLLVRAGTFHTFFIAGILMGIAVFIRTNLAYVGVCVGFFIVFTGFAAVPRSISRSILAGLAYAAGGCLVSLVAFLPFAVRGYQDLWWASVVSAPMSYAASQLSVPEAFIAQVGFIRHMLSDIRGPQFGLGVLVWGCGAAGLLAELSHWRSRDRRQRQGLVVVLVFLLGTSLSIVRGGAAFEHYLIQLVPFVALASAAFLNRCWTRRTRWLIVGVLFTAAAGPLVPMVPLYGSEVYPVLSGRQPPQGIAYDIAAYLERENVSKEPVYLMTDHIVYWLIKAYPLSASTVHPSNIAKEYLLEVIAGPGTTPEMELKRVLAMRPRYIITTRDIWYLRNRPAASALLDETLKTHYDLVRQIRGRLIYRRTGEKAVWSCDRVMG